MAGVVSVKIIIGTLFGLILLWLAPLVQAEGEFQVSFSCNGCHPDRYVEWTRSMHALAVNDPVFETAYLRALESDPKYRYYCLGCHSPITRVTNDFNLTESISTEGVTCSFCHSVTAVENNNYTFNQSNPMQGPYKDSKTNAHASAYSELHTKSEFCAGCHEFSINGVPVFQTYTEWKESPYAAEGKQCQDCHMEVKRGTAAKNGPIREKVYQHFWYGGHTGGFFENTLHVESTIQQTGNRAKVTLNITSRNVGHKIPSGIPSRKVILNFSATDGQGRYIFSDQRIYAKTLVDQYNNEVSDFWKVTSIARDNRIAPGESRIETFAFEVPNGTDKIETQAVLTYQIEAEILQPISMSVEIANMSNSTSWLNSSEARGATPKATSGLGGSGTMIVLAVILLYMYSRRKKLR